MATPYRKGQVLHSVFAAALEYNMNSEEQRERQIFFDEITNYSYIRPDGRLVLEPFCVYLSHCFGFDGVLELSPQPVDVYRLLINIIHEELGSTEAEKYIQVQNIADWRPELAYIFPEKK